VKQVHVVIQTPWYATTNADEMDVLGVFLKDEDAKKFILSEMERKLEELLEQNLDASDLEYERDDIRNTYLTKSTSVVSGLLFEEGDE
jgi:hypothetical protein